MIVLPISKTKTNEVKGCAIILVIIAHIGVIFSRVFTPLGGVGVYLFLLLSGYGLTCSYKVNGLQKYWRKRFFQVFLPYWIIQLVSYFFRSDLTVKNIIFDLFLIKLIHPIGWYLNYLLLWYITFYFVHLIKNGKIRKAIFLF